MNQGTYPYLTFGCRKQPSAGRAGACATRFWTSALSRQTGFTLIELMVVIGIASMILAIGMPSFVRLLKKDPMRQAVSDILDACSQARAQAIISGSPVELRFQPQDYAFSTGQAPEADWPGANSNGGSTAASEDGPTPRRVASMTPVSGRWSEQLNLEMLDVNFRPFKDEPEAKVRFFPNGTSDEFTIVLSWPEKNQYRKISLDIITGLADMEVIR